MRKTMQRRGVLLAIVLVALAGCGGDGGGSPAALQNDGAEGGSQTTQCQAGSSVVARVMVAAPGDRFYGMHTRVVYPSSLSIPGRGGDQAAVDRVRFRVAMPTVRYDVPEATFTEGSSVVNDEDSDFDGVDDRVQALVIARTPFPDGEFADITFDCAATIEWPTGDLFACEVAGLTDLTFNEIAAFASCNVVVQPPQ